MYDIQKVPMYNVCVVDVVFCIEGTLYNDGRIAIDRDSFEFAGYLADDIILGFYKDGVYDIHYHYNRHEDPYSEEGMPYVAPMSIKFGLEDITELTGRKFISASGYTLKFRKVETKDRKLISEVVQKNQSLIDMQI